MSIIIVGAILYWGRDRSIDFVSIFPNTFKYCGKEINKTEKEYKELILWFKENKNGWKNAPASYIPGTVFSSQGISVNILKNSVIVNFSSNSIEWNQVIKKKKGNELLMKCKSANKSLHRTHLSVTPFAAQKPRQPAFAAELNRYKA